MCLLDGISLAEIELISIYDDPPPHPPPSEHVCVSILYFCQRRKQTKRVAAPRVAAGRDHVDIQPLGAMDGALHRGSGPISSNGEGLALRLDKKDFVRRERVSVKVRRKHLRGGGAAGHPAKTRSSAGGPSNPAGGNQLRLREATAFRRLSDVTPGEVGTWLTARGQEDSSWLELGVRRSRIRRSTRRIQSARVEPAATRTNDSSAQINRMVKEAHDHHWDSCYILESK